MFCGTPQRICVYAESCRMRVAFVQRCTVTDIRRSGISIRGTGCFYSFTFLVGVLQQGSHSSERFGKLFLLFYRGI